MIRRIKIIALGILIAIFSLLLIGVGILFFYKNEIVHVIINELNKKIDTQITVEKTDFTLIKSFPNAAIHFYNIEIASSKKFSSEKNTPNLLEAKKLSIHFNLYQLLFKKYIINGIRLEEAKINILTNAKGESNYKFWKDDTTSTNSDFQSNLNRIILKKVQVQFVDYKTNTIIKSYISSLAVKGNIDNKEIDISINLIANNSSYKQNKTTYNFNNKLFISTNLSKIGNLLTCKDIKLEYKQIKIEGNASSDTKGYQLKAKIGKTKILDLENLLKELDLYELKNSNGEIDATFDLEGKYKSNTWQLKSNITLFDVQSDIQKNCKFNNINGNIQIERNIANIWQINSQNIEGKFFSSTFKANGNFTYSQHPRLKGEIELKITPTDINQFIDSSLCYFSDGEINANISLESLPEFSFEKNFNEADFKYKVEIESNNLSGESLKTYKFDKVNAKLVFENDALKITESFGNVNNNKLRFNGELVNVIKSMNDRSYTLGVSGNLFSESMDAESLVYKDTSESTFNYAGEINAECTRLKFQKIKMQNFKSKVGFNNYEEYHLSNLNASICKGKIYNSDVYFSGNKNTTLLKTQLKFKEISIKELFGTFDNFGQHQLSAANVDGKLTGNLSNILCWENDKIAKNKISGVAAFELNDGELTNFKPVEKLSSFLEIDDINHIKFRKIKNQLRINNGIVSIPQMDIQSTALNIALSGQHSLENEYEYHFSLLLSEILYKKAKRKMNKDSEFGKIEEDTLGRSRIFIKLSGKDETYKISYDTKQALQTFGNRLKNEKQSLKQIVKEEFGLFKDEPNKPQEIQNNKKIEIESEELKPKKEPEKEIQKPKRNRQPK